MESTNFSEKKQEDDGFSNSQTEARSSTRISPESSPQLHSFWDFEPVVFQVENILFRVPKYGFLDSAPRSPFVAMFGAPPPDPEHIEGASLSNPIILEGTSAQDFHNFLRILYPLQGPVVSYEDWIGVLRLAHKWNYDKIRQEAINALSPFLTNKTAEKIRLGNEFLIRDWLRQGMIDVVQSKTLELGDLSSSPFHFNWETIGKIFYIKYKEVRESAGEKKICKSCRTSYGLGREFLTCTCRAAAFVENHFKAELASVEFNTDDHGDNAPSLQPS